MTTLPTSFDASRRLFLRHSQALLCATGAGAPLALGLGAMAATAAAAATDYKALVCIFLNGGNDAYNTVLATDRTSWERYFALRSAGDSPIALLPPGTAPDASAAWGSRERLGGVLPIAPRSAQGRSFALHPSLRALQQMFNTTPRLAIVANAGTLIAPVVKGQQGPLPKNLYSHNDQRALWWALTQEGGARGWGGRIADRVAAANGQALLTAVSAVGRSTWLGGSSVQGISLGSAGLPGLGGNHPALQTESFRQALARVATAARADVPLDADVAQVASRYVAVEQALRAALPPAGRAPFGTPVGTGPYVPARDPRLMYANPANGKTETNDLAVQLQTVARVIHAGTQGGLGMRRQVFFVEMGGFDTHDAQMATHASLLAKLGHGMQYFDQLVAELGLRDQVTAFTGSDFGRPFVSNGDGTDHGWGGHHFVIGGAVRGGDVHGAFPVYGTKNAAGEFPDSPDQMKAGVMVPRLSVEQMAFTVGRWFGVERGDLLEILPNLRNFDASAHDLGFMAA